MLRLSFIPIGGLALCGTAVTKAVLEINVWPGFRSREMRTQYVAGVCEVTTTWYSPEEESH